MCYAPLHQHSYYSLLDGLPSPKQIIDRCKELGLPAAALTDHGNIFGMVAFHNAAKKAGVKAIQGIELYVCEQDPAIKSPENNKRNHLTVLAKNQEGLETLMRLVSETNRPDYFYRKPRIDLERLRPFTKDGNLLCLSGCLAGKLSSQLFEDLNEACKVSTTTESLDQVRKLLKPNWRDLAAQTIAEYQDVFGKENYYLEIQYEGMAVQRVVMDCLREMAGPLGVKKVATLDAHYCRPEDAMDQRILLYSQMHTTQEQQEQLRQSGGDTMYFFHSDNFFIYSPEEMQKHYTADEIANTLEIADRVGKTKLGRPPCLPKFSNDEMKALNVDSDKYVEELCVRAAKERLGNLTVDKKKEYWQRLQYELLVIREAKLSDYFLIEWDVCRFVDENDGPRGKGRGSGAGSLVNYLLGITDIDPIPYGLYFERFYNASRNIPPHFDVGEVPFLTWLGDNFEAAVKRDKAKARKQVGLAVANGPWGKPLPADKALLQAEAQWIDDNNPKMWLYIVDQIANRKDGVFAENKCNSQLAYALGFTEEIDHKKPVATVEAHVSLPDIDSDIGVVFRSKVIKYLTDRWGEERVCQMITFGRLQGKAALKEVFRAQPDTVKQMMRLRAMKEGKDPNSINISPYDLCNEITQYIPDEAAISDDLAQAREETGDDRYGILQWAIDHIPQVAESYQWYKPLFDQAMRIEGTKKSQSKHAAGIIIADRPIAELFPLAYDATSKSRVCALEMAAAEAMGGVKFDFLGVTALDKLWRGRDLINQNSAKLEEMDEELEMELGEDEED